MPIIQLQAKLQAYSRAPYYNDLIREAPQDSTSYVRKDGEWVGLDTTLLEGSLEDFRNQVESLEATLGNLTIELSGNGQYLIFTKYDGSKVFLSLPTSRVDFKTLGVNKDDGSLYVLDAPDNRSIEVVDVEYEQDPNDYEINIKTKGTLRAKALYVDNLGGSARYITGSDIENRISNAEKNIQDLENYTQGVGGLLKPCKINDLGGMSPEYRNFKLSEEAKKQLYSEGPTDGPIPDQTKIKNLYDGHIWVYVSNSNDKWIDEGADPIVNANNKGVLGAVTGDPSTKFKISINNDGTMSVNGLEAEFEKVLYTDDLGDIEGSSLVTKTEDGRIKAETPTDDDDVTTKKWVEDELAKVSGGVAIEEDDLNSILNELWGVEGGN